MIAVSVRTVSNTELTATGVVFCRRSRIFRMFWRKQARRFARSRSGVTALEFAILAPTFLIVLVGTMEVGIAYGAQASLQNAANIAARLVRTGQAQATALTQTQFRDQICASIQPLLACDENL